MGSYRQPMMLQPLDFSRVSNKLSEAGKSIVDSFNQRQALRLARAEEFKSDYKKYAEKVILDNNEYLADETREIMQENLLNIDNFAAMSEGDRLKTMSSVQSFNNSNKIASKLINELGAMELDARSWDDPVVQITQAYVSGNFEDVKRIPHTNGKIGADFEVSLRDENGELTGEKRLITQNEFVARGNNILTTSPESDIEIVNTTVSDLIQQHQKNLDDFSSRGGTYDPTNKVRQYFETMDEEVLDTYYGNVFRKGDDYLEIPDTDVSSNKLTDEDKQAIFEIKREELINHLTKRVTNELIKKPYPKVSTTTTGGSGTTKTEKFNTLPQNTIKDLTDALDISIKGPVSRKTTTRRGELGFEYENIQFDNGNQKIYRTTATSGLIGKQIQTGDKTIFVRDAFILDGKIHITDLDYVSGEGYMPTDVLELPAEGLGNILATGSAPVENDPLGLGI
jgi:hypothetical protein